MADVLNWMSQQIYNYQDPDSSLVFSILIDCGVSREEDRYNYHPGRLCLSIRDSRAFNRKVVMELKYSELCELNSKFEKLYDPDRKKAYETNVHTFCEKFDSYGKKRVEFEFKMIKESGKQIPICILSIYTGKEQTLSIKLTPNVISVIRSLIKQVQENYVMVSSNIQSIGSTKMMIDAIKESDKISVRNTSAILKALQRIEEKITGTIEPVVFDDSTNVSECIYDATGSVECEPNEFPEVKDNVETIQHDFDESMLTMINNIDLGLDRFKECKSLDDEIKDESDVVEEVEPIIAQQSFIRDFIDNDIMRMGEWVSAWSLTGVNTTSKTMFTPITHIIKRYNSSFEPSENMIKAEQIMIEQYRQSVRTNLEGKGFTPAVKVYASNDVYNNKNLLNLVSDDIIMLYLLYSYINKNYVDKLTNVRPEFKSNMKEIREFIKDVLMSIPMSMKYNEMSDSELDEKEDRILERMTYFINSGLLSNLNKEYSTDSFGGKIIISPETSKKFIGKFIDMISRGNTFLFNDDDISNMYSICDNVVEVKKSKDKKVINNTNEKEDDHKLSIFLTASKKYMSASDLDTMTTYLGGNYDKLKYYFREFNVPKEIKVMKRILDSNDKITNRSELLKEISAFKEDETVTECRITADINPVYQDVEFDPDIEKQLFGDVF